jgi:hypothetical protein
MLLTNQIGKPFQVNQLLCCQTSLVIENVYRKTYGYQNSRNLIITPLFYKGPLGTVGRDSSVGIETR